MEARPDAGMCASQVRLYRRRCARFGRHAGCGDGSSKQRGHGRPPKFFPVTEEVLFPSGSAALYRRAMLDQIGLFDESFFLYCEDTDLGLRARWAGWRCLYVPEAVVEHHYSHSAGRASPLKAYYVERNRLFVLVKNFPARMLAAAPFVRWRDMLALAILLRGPRRAARFRAGRRFRLAHAVLRAARALGAAAATARRFGANAARSAAPRALTPHIYRRLLRAHSISARQVASL